MVKLIKKEKNSEILYESDETFAFIAGYTSGGAPYGITWEEMNGWMRMRWRMWNCRLTKETLELEEKTKEFGIPYKKIRATVWAVFLSRTILIY